MSPTGRPRIGLYLLATLLLVLILDLVATVSGQIDHVNHEVTQSISGFNGVDLNPLMVTLTYLGTDPVLFTIVGICFWWAWRNGVKRDGWSLLCAAVVARVLGIVFKEALMQPRPMLKQPPSPLHVLHGYGYPSGHALMSTVVLGLIAIGVWRYAHNIAKHLVLCLVVVLTLGIGLSRIYLGFHWINDVIGGYLLGLVIVTGTLVIDAHRPGKPIEQ